MHWLKARKGAGVFAAIQLLLIAQVAWWAWVFTRDANVIASLQRFNARDAAQIAAIEDEAFHRKVMFLSETAFFAVAACLGMWILHRALRSERRSRELQRQFIEMVSHQSKTPLTALKLRLEALRDKAPDTETASTVGLALDEVRRLAGVLEKTLDLNRSERRALQFESLCLSEVVASVIHRLEPWLNEKKARVVLNADEEVEVLGDFASLQNSVQSLLENAVLHNPSAHREVKVSIASKGARAVLRVQDNGPGIDPSDQGQVFERFYRGANRQRVSGTGLGLYLARAIVEAHRGVLRLVPVSGVGACFEIDLPKGTTT